MKPLSKSLLGSPPSKQSSQNLQYLPQTAGESEFAGEVERNQLTTLNGCYVPCLLNILGAVLFLRVGFAVGTLGLVSLTVTLKFKLLMKLKVHSCHCVLVGCTWGVHVLRGHRILDHLIVLCHRHKW